MLADSFHLISPLLISYATLGHGQSCVWLMDGSGEGGGGGGGQRSRGPNCERFITASAGVAETVRQLQEGVQAKSGYTED